MERDTELTLVRRLRAGDPEAFDIVYEAYHARLFTFLVRLGRRRDGADDLLEETWLRLVANARRLQPDTRLGAWLFAVARNVYYTACRSRLMEEACSADLIGLWPAASAVPSPFDATAATELGRCLDRALAALPDRDREVLLLVDAEGFTAAEVAALPVLEPGRTASARIRSRCRRRLRRSAWRNRLTAPAIAEAWPVIVESALIALAAVYLAEVVQTVFRLALR